jgi:hypothetical protein
MVERRNLVVCDIIEGGGKRLTVKGEDGCFSDNGNVDILTVMLVI